MVVGPAPCRWLPHLLLMVVPVAGLPAAGRQRTRADVGTLAAGEARPAGDADLQILRRPGTPHDQRAARVAVAHA